ncbi:MAG: hypothetical protein BMS9Abin29_1768 [Gemmatimonadota bacterium]|nr:MAG: hypothetical protein BMS9Abin29_1768 [Gemmatimonadota bacterium]
MLLWLSVLLLSTVVSGAVGRRWWIKRRASINAANRILERPNSYYSSKGVRDQEDAEWYDSIDLDKLHEVNRAEIERLIAQIEGAGIDSLRPSDRAFLERIADLDAPERKGDRPRPATAWPSWA